MLKQLRIWVLSWFAAFLFWVPVLTGQGLAAPPPAPKALSPTGMISDTTINFTWQAVADASRYQLIVRDTKGVVMNTNYKAADAGCVPGGKCSARITAGVERGECSWKVRAKNNDGWGPFTKLMRFTVAAEARIPISSAPYTITDPGSYYLTRDLYSDGNGIVVQADDVTIDLGGYRLARLGVGAPAGVTMDCRTNVEIRNGVIHGFAYGVLESSYTYPEYPGRGHRVINVRVVDSVYYGIRLTGSGHTVKGCTVDGTGWNDGIQVGKGSSVVNNTVQRSGGNGIFAGEGSLLEGNVVYNNGAQQTLEGAGGIAAAQGCTLIGNTAYSNYCYGIDTLWGQHLLDRNVAYNNNQAGGSYTNIKACPTCTFGVNHMP